MYENIAILCGHYEGVDERVLEAYVDEEISIGDYVLTGGELPALVVADAVCRMKDGVLSLSLIHISPGQIAGQDRMGDGRCGGPAARPGFRGREYAVDPLFVF